MTESKNIKCDLVNKPNTCVLINNEGKSISYNLLKTNLTYNTKNNYFKLNKNNFIFIAYDVANNTYKPITNETMTLISSNAPAIALPNFMEK